MRKNTFLFVVVGLSLLAGATLFAVTEGAHSNQDAAIPQNHRGLPNDVASSTPSDVRKTPETAPVVSASDVPSVGYVTRHHAAELVNTEIKVPGYMIKNLGTYIIVSDEKVDVPNPHDLPVMGTGISRIVPLKKYLFTGKFVKGGLNASNKNPYHLELIVAPEPLKF